MVTLYVLSDYLNRGYSYKKGDVISVSVALSEFLLSDSPESFSLKPPAKEVKEAPKDKAVKRPRRAKGAK